MGPNGNGRGSNFTYIEVMTLKELREKTEFADDTTVLVAREPGSLTGDIRRARVERLEFKPNGGTSWKAAAL